ncbi:MAG: preprotein translocase subunit YajC [Acidimicrobiales bacterium]
MASLLFFLVPLVLLWVLLVRPQQQRMRQAQALAASLEVGDDVVTAGGIYGSITDTDDTTLWLEIAPGVVVRVSRAGVSSRVSSPDDEIDDDEIENDEMEDDIDDNEQAGEKDDSPHGHDQPVPQATTERAPRDDES